MHNLGARGALGKAGETGTSTPERRRSRRDKRRSSRESKKLQKKRTYSFSPGRKDSIAVEGHAHRPPVPPLPAEYQRQRSAESEMQQTVRSQEFLMRTSTDPMQEWQRVPTLRKRRAQDLPRRKSSKKRKEEHDREAQVKAMIPLMPERPATDPLTSGRPMKRESRRMHNGLNHRLHNPSSDISLPSAESMNSSLSSMSDNQPAYILSALEMLAPRPTIKYSDMPRSSPAYSGLGSNLSDRRKRRVSDRLSNLEETIKANKRIDDLADGFDASDLRELMERDQTRREKKQQAIQIKLERKLGKRQEKQRAAEADAARNGTPPPAVMERGVMGREVLGPSSGNSAVVTTTKRKDSDMSERRKGKRPAELSRQNSVTAVSGASPVSEVSDPMIEVAREQTITKTVSPPASPVAPTHPPHLMDVTNTTPSSKKPSSSRRSSGDSNRAPQSWTSIFKWGSRSKRGLPQPSFSNTSRDSMQAGQVTQLAPMPPRVSTSNAPRRTMSRFREDLPETPISPPDSRLQSPVADVLPLPHAKEAQKSIVGLEDAQARHDTPASGLDSAIIREETPTSGHRSSKAPSPEPAMMNQSLASIDSEGSWLSGRKGGSKRGSSQMASHQLRDSVSSIQKHYKEYSESAEELGIAEDEYFSRLSPGPDDESKLNRLSAGNPMPSSDEEDGSSLAVDTSFEPLTKWVDVAHTPTVVHRQPLAKSREGLLRDFENDSGTERSTPRDSNRQSYGLQEVLVDEAGDGDIDEEENSSLQRAKSVDLGKKHVRHISAGSARLLDLKPRDSVDSKRASTGSGTG